MRIHHLQHVSFDGPGTMKSYFLYRGHQLSSTHLYIGQPLPSIDEFDWLIVMGGPMGVYDEIEFPWMNEEKSLIQKSIDSGKVVLDICLGAQLIADVLGAKVFKNEYREIGWFRLNAKLIPIVLSYLRFRRANPNDWKNLRAWLIERALEHDKPTLLLEFACEYLHMNKIMRPGITSLEGPVIEARQKTSRNGF